MIKGSHNSMTYMKPQNWWMKKYMCQTKTLKEQIKSGVRMFDIKVRFDSKDNVYITNGKYTSKINWTHVDFISMICDTINLYANDRFYINLTLDTSDVSLGQEINFIQLCNRFVKSCSDNIIITGGRRSFDNEKVVVTLQDTMIAEAISGNDKRTRFYEKWFPVLFAKRMNEKNFKFWKNEDCIVSFDFL